MAKALNSARWRCSLASPHLLAHHQEENHREEVHHRVCRRTRRGERGSDGGSREAGQELGTEDVCVLLPDPKSSVRWETQDRPALVKSFKMLRGSRT